MVKIHLYQKEIKKICTHQHLSAEEITKQLKEKFPKAGLSTVYRNVEEMVQSKILKKLNINKGKSLYETNIGIHAHLLDNITWIIHDIKLQPSECSFLPKNFSAEEIEITINGTRQNKK